MAGSSLYDWSAEIDSRGQDVIVQRYRVELDAASTDPYWILHVGQNSGPAPLPYRGQHFGTGTLLFARTFSIKTVDECRKLYEVEVSYQVPEGKQDEQEQSPNPLLRAAVYNLEYVEKEYAIEQAYNVEALAHGNGTGGNRAALTLGPVVNAAGKQPDERLMDTERNAVLTILKNYPALDSIATLNETYQRTTNNAEFLGFATRRCKFQLVESQGVQVENGIAYWPGLCRIEITKTTDRRLDNVGYQEWNIAANAFRPETVQEPEPRALTLGGQFSSSGYTTITYRHLDPTDYSPLA